MAIRIAVSRQLDGTTFSLHPEDRDRLQQISTAMIPNQVYVGHDTAMAYEEIHGPMWRQIALILTGISEQQLQDVGGVEFIEGSRILHTVPEAA